VTTTPIDRVMGRLREHARELVLASLAVGLLAAPAPRWTVLALLGGVVVVGVVLRDPRLVGLLVVGVLIGSTLGDARLTAIDRSVLRPLIGHAATARVTLLEAPRAQRFGGWTAPARIQAGTGKGERVVLRWAAPALRAAAGAETTEAGAEPQRAGAAAPDGGAPSHAPTPTPRRRSRSAPSCSCAGGWWR
jgi:hypothetical protein